MSTQTIATIATSISRRQATPATSTGREPILVIEADADFGRALVEQLAADGHQGGCPGRRGTLVAARV